MEQTSPTARGGPVRLGKQRAAQEQKLRAPCGSKQLITARSKHHAYAPWLVRPCCAEQGQVALGGKTT